MSFWRKNIITKYKLSIVRKDRTIFRDVGGQLTMVASKNSKKPLNYNRNLINAQLFTNYRTYQSYKETFRHFIR